IGDRIVGERIQVIGMITGVRRITTKTNRTMAVLEVEDLTGSIEIVAFPDSFDQHGSRLEPDAILAFTAKIDERGESRQLILDSVTDELPEIKAVVTSGPTVAIQLPATSDVWSDIDIMQSIERVLRRYEGEQPVVFLVPTQGGNLRLKSRTRRVEWCDELVRDLDGVLGSNMVTIERPKRAVAAVGDAELQAVAD
ncbi:MAG TPA: OB-fold nucleic acid binding domain-containing protein, partial [Thermomicrobiales bacterium]|nr:OB-fold nucleic acid binding domain-containing protein [Thermomicrobiales bacterium]